jgi:hydroxypyruvate reductase
MSIALDLRQQAGEIFSVALRSVDARAAIKRAVRVEGSQITFVENNFDLAHEQKIYVVAFGKAAHAMAVALEQILGARITAGVASCALPPAFAQPERWRTFAGGHPVPNEASLEAARSAFDLLRRADEERALVIFLISGGGSAMMEWPRDARISLAELRALNETLVNCGASIAEINAVRRAVSAVKGGGLAARATHAAQVSLIISDTNAGAESNVASGPTFPPPTGAPDAQAVIARYQLTNLLPVSVQRALKENSAPVNSENFNHPFPAHHVLLDNDSALRMAATEAEARGFIVEIAQDLIEQPINEGCAQLVARLLTLYKLQRGELKRGVCVISGGEFACPVMGSGVGGRNSETALRCAFELEAQLKHFAGTKPSHVAWLSAGTDGIDGNSPAAGAFADHTTLVRARALGLDAERALNSSDSYTFFNALGDALVIGATGTNVRDVRILLAH